jgi:hypothetical protein
MYQLAGCPKGFSPVRDYIQGEGFTPGCGEKSITQVIHVTREKVGLSPAFANVLTRPGKDGKLYCDELRYIPVDDFDLVDSLFNHLGPSVAAIIDHTENLPFDEWIFDTATFASLWSELRSTYMNKITAGVDLAKRVLPAIIYNRQEKEAFRVGEEVVMADRCKICHRNVHHVVVDDGHVLVTAFNNGRPTTQNSFPCFINFSSWGWKELKFRGRKCIWPMGKDEFGRLDGHNFDSIALVMEWGESALSDLGLNVNRYDMWCHYIQHSHTHMHFASKDRFLTVAGISVMITVLEMSIGVLVTNIVRNIVNGMGIWRVTNALDFHVPPRTVSSQLCSEMKPWYYMLIAIIFCGWFPNLSKEDVKSAASLHRGLLHAVYNFKFSDLCLLVSDCADNDMVPMTPFVYENWRLHDYWIGAEYIRLADNGVVYRLL